MLLRSLKIIFSLIKGYFIYSGNKKFLLYKIIFLFFATAFVILLINAFSHGVYQLTHKSITSGYGDIYIQLKQKMKKEIFLKKNIEKKITAISEVSSIDIYGLTHGLLVSGDYFIPVYVLSMLNKTSNLLNQFSQKKSKDGFYCGQVLYKKYNNLYKKKIVMITSENKKIKSLNYDAMPISFSQGYNFGWDEWNEKAIVIPVENMENYFDIPTIEFLHVYVKNKNRINIIIEELRKSLFSEIHYIDAGIKVLPEYNKFLLLLNIITHSITFIIFIFSIFLLCILMSLYLYENKNEFYSLIIIGIKNNYIFISLILFFLIVAAMNLFFGYLIGYAVVTVLNFFQFFVISLDSMTYFDCVVNWKFLLYYFGIYIAFIILSIVFFYKKYLF